METGFNLLFLIPVGLLVVLNAGCSLLHSLTHVRLTFIAAAAAAAAAENVGK